MTETPADTLRQAAEIARELVTPVERGGVDHAATWSPSAAVAVAALLDFVAAGREALDAVAVLRGEDTTRVTDLFRDVEQHALAVARALLGEA